jgi:thiamine pyrophosphokinase
MTDEQGGWLYRGWRPAAVVLAGGPLPDPGWLRSQVAMDEAYVACADGGVRHLRPLGLTAHLWMGDGDSLEGADAQGVPAESLLFPVDKEETDLELVLAVVSRRKLTPVALLGAIGARWDHTLANFHLAAAFRMHGGPIALYGEGCRARILWRDEEVLVAEEGYDTVSLVPLAGDVLGVTSQGLRWELDGRTLAWDRARGVSNRLAGARATVRVGQGLAVLLEQRT